MSKKKPERAAAVCERALDRVDVAIENRRSGRPEDLSIEVLQQVRQQLQRMFETLDAKEFSPSYGRFILDWPDEHGLIEELLVASQEYLRWT
jgi:hypothetical protein